jgi:hypothetical protein
VYLDLRRNNIMLNYTKGKWEVSKPYQQIPYSVSSSEKYPIARLGFSQEDEANASLIASAPDMYEALKEADKIIIGLCRKLNHTCLASQCKSCPDRKSSSIPKAIAKAEGK